MTNPNTRRFAESLRDAALEPFSGVAARIAHVATAEGRHDRKLCKTLEDAIRASGLKDGMTISFHHGFREGDKTINMVTSPSSASPPPTPSATPTR